MPETPLNEKIKSQLLAELQCARDNHKAGISGADEYSKALKRLNDFLVDGILPDDLKTTTNGLPGPKRSVPRSA